MLRDAAKAALRRTYRHGLWAVPSRYEIPEVLNRRGLLGTGVEVGVGQGAYSAILLERWKGARLISVDPWRKEDDPEGVELSTQGARDRSYAKAVQALAPFGSRNEIWRMTSAEGAAQTPAGTLDFAYIDAWHAYESVREDLRLWFDKVRRGGLLCGHDYRDGVIDGYPYGVKTAVDEFCEERDLSFSLTRRLGESRSWMIEMP